MTSAQIDRDLSCPEFAIGAPEIYFPISCQCMCEVTVHSSTWLVVPYQTAEVATSCFFK